MKALATKKPRAIARREPPAKGKDAPRKKAASKKTAKAARAAADSKGIERAREENREIRMMMARGRYAAAIVHTINNMTMVLMAHCDHLRIGREEDDPALAKIAGMERAVEQIEEAVAGLSALAGERDEHPKPAPAGAVIARGLPILRRLLPRAIATAEPRMKVDAGWQVAMGLERAIEDISYLAAIVRRALPQGGALGIAVETNEGAPGKQSNRQGEGSVLRWVFEASGSPPGRSGAAELLGKNALGIGFEAQMALSGLRDQDYRGLIAFQMKRLAKGGLRLTLDLPCSRPAEMAGGPIEGCVLLAAGDAYSRALAAGALRGTGCEVIACGSAEEALEAWTSRPGIPSLLVLDRAATEGMTTERLEQIAKIGKHAYVVMVRSASEQDDGPLAAMALSLVRPFSMGELTRLVRRAFESQKREGESR